MNGDKPKHTVVKVTDTLQYSRTRTITSMAEEEVEMEDDSSSPKPAKTLSLLWRMVTALLAAMALRAPRLIESGLKRKNQRLAIPDDADEEVEG